MRSTMTIAGRQLRGYFNGPVAYIVVCLITAAVGFMFWRLFFLYSRASLRELFSFLSFGLAFAAPAISMGLVAEERRSGTLELLITMPVTEADVVIGKFLGGLGLLTTLLLATLPWAVSVSTLGPLDWGPVFTGYLGVFLEGAALLAIGLAASSFTDNQLVAFFVSLAFSITLVLLAHFMLPFTGSLIPVVSAISFHAHVESATRGVLALRDVVYFLSVIGFALMLSFRAIESRRWS